MTRAAPANANGFKPKTVHARVGALTPAVPQARGVEFHPSALEKGVCSERAEDVLASLQAEFGVAHSRPGAHAPFHRPGRFRFDPRRPESEPAAAVEQGFGQNVAGLIAELADDRFGHRGR